MLAGTDTAYKLAKKYKLKTAFGTDILFSHALAQRQGALLATAGRAGTRPPKRSPWRPATNANCWRCQESAAPIPASSVSSKEGALADLLLVDGDPIADIKLIADPAKNFVVIMKDGKIYKNSLPQ